MEIKPTGLRIRDPRGKLVGTGPTGVRIEGSTRVEFRPGVEPVSVLLREERAEFRLGVGPVSGIRGDDRAEFCLGVGPVSGIRGERRAGIKCTKSNEYHKKTYLTS